MIKTIGDWIITDIDVAGYDFFVYLGTFIDVDLEKRRKKINEKENIKIPLLSPNTGKPFAILTISEEDDKVNVDRELIDEREEYLYKLLHIKTINQYKDKLQISITATLRISKFLIIEEKDNGYIIRLKLPACVLPLYFTEATDILESIENSKNPESFYISVSTSSLSWRDLPEPEEDELRDKEREFFESIGNRITFDYAYINLHKNNKIIKSGLILDIGYYVFADFEGLINIYYDKKEKSMIAEFLIDKLLLYINLHDEYTHIRVEKYNFVTLDFLSKKNLLDKPISSGKLEIPLKEHNTAIEYGFYITEYLNIAGKGILYSDS